MLLLKWTGFIAALVLLAACFMPWISVDSIHTTITGVDTAGTGFGKPAYLHLILIAVFLLFLYIPRIWSARGNLVAAALNMAWAIRNFLIITLCRGGECPERHAAIYLVLISSALMLIAALFPDTKLKTGNK